MTHILECSVCHIETENTYKVLHCMHCGRYICTDCGIYVGSEMAYSCRLCLSVHQSEHTFYSMCCDVCHEWCRIGQLHYISFKWICFNCRNEGEEL
jgi:hypothetical protein